MLKKRVIPVLLYANRRLVKTVRFDLETARNVGDPVKSVAVYNSQLADEIVLVSIDRGRRGWGELAGLLEKISQVCFMPLTIGGGIKTYEDAAFLIARGADKVVINSAAYSDKALLSRIADRFGKQAVVVSIDARTIDGRHALFSDCGRTPKACSLQEHIATCDAAGAGEFFVQSIDSDGVMLGYDIDLLKQAAAATNSPIIGCGGAGHYEHLKDAFLSANLGAVACGSLFNFTDSNPIRAKAFLSNHGLPFKKI